MRVGKKFYNKKYTTKFWDLNAIYKDAREGILK